MSDRSGTPESFDVTGLNRIRQVHERGRYDRATVYGILDRGLVAHVAFVDQGRPIVIPMAYGRDGDRFFLHGSRKSRIAGTANGELVCIGVTLVDGLVVASSMFDSSMNYRAVVIHGRAIEVKDPAARLHAMRCVSEHNLPGRWDEVRAPHEQELKATGVLEVVIEAASAKVREGSVVDNEVVTNGRTWVGVVPVITSLGSAERDPRVPNDVAMPDSITRLRTPR